MLFTLKLLYDLSTAKSESKIKAKDKVLHFANAVHISVVRNDVKINQIEGEIAGLQVSRRLHIYVN